VIYAIDVDFKIDMESIYAADILIIFYTRRIQTTSYTSSFQTKCKLEYGSCQLIIVYDIMLL